MKGQFKNPEERSAKLKAIWEAKRNGTYVAPEKKPSNGKRGRPRKVVEPTVEPTKEVWGFWFEDNKNLVCFTTKKDWMKEEDFKSESEALVFITNKSKTDKEAKEILSNVKKNNCCIAF